MPHDVVQLMLFKKPEKIKSAKNALKREIL
jgi:hypothetical protein